MPPSRRITTNSKGSKCAFIGDITYLIAINGVADFTLNVLEYCSMPFLLTISRDNMG